VLKNYNAVRRRLWAELASWDSLCPGEWVHFVLTQILLVLSAHEFSQGPPHGDSKGNSNVFGGMCRSYIYAKDFLSLLHRIWSKSENLEKWDHLEKCSFFFLVQETKMTQIFPWFSRYRKIWPHGISWGWVVTFWRKTAFDIITSPP
jgi:hypothetical protein